MKSSSRELPLNNVLVICNTSMFWWNEILFMSSIFYPFLLCYSKQLPSLIIALRVNFWFIFEIIEHLQVLHWGKCETTQYSTVGETHRTTATGRLRYHATIKSCGASLERQGHSIFRQILWVHAVRTASVVWWQNQKRNNFAERHPFFGSTVYF